MKKQKPPNPPARTPVLPTKTKIPGWCAAYVAGHERTDLSEFVEIMTNWHKFQAMIREKHTTTFLVLLLMAELGTKNRPDFVSRIYRRFVTVRREEELAALWKIYPDAGCRAGKFIR